MYDLELRTHKLFLNGRNKLLISEVVIKLCHLILNRKKFSPYYYPILFSIKVKMNELKINTGIDLSFVWDLSSYTHLTKLAVASKMYQTSLKNYSSRGPVDSVRRPLMWRSQIQITSQSWRFLIHYKNFNFVIL